MKSVFPQYRDKTMDDFDAKDEALERAVTVTKNYIADLKGMMDLGRGIVFAGQNGVGKTHLACVVMGEAKAAGYKIECIELSTWIQMHQERIAVANSNYEDDEERAYELRQRLRYIQKGADFLLLDDLGREHASQSGWSSEQVFDLLRYRWNRKLPTLLTTNLPFMELDKRYTEGLSSFLREAMILVDMESEDHRNHSMLRVRPRETWSTGN